MKIIYLIAMLSGTILSTAVRAEALAKLDAYNVEWTTPSRNAAGSMPLGNGEVGINLWVEENGDLLLYVARTDAFSEACRLMKLGRVRVSLSPNPFTKGVPFRQILKLRDGCAEITSGRPGKSIKLQVFVDADHPVIHVAGTSEAPLSVKASLETWRMQRKQLLDNELESSWTMRQAPKNIEVWESADVICSDRPDAVIVYHRNESSIVPLTLKHQGLEAAADKIADPLHHRTFGLWLEADGFAQDGTTALRSSQSVKSFAVKIVGHTAQTPTAAEWLEQAGKIAKESTAAQAAGTSTAQWWQNFWGRSWILAEGDSPKGRPSRITQAYLLQRWIAACAGRGHYPIKFNGSLFTVDPQFTKAKGTPDWRRWGDCYWWQNTRLPYQPMPASGDFEQMRSLFRFYESLTPFCEARAKIYHQVKGAYYPETMTIFGTYSNNDYGWNRAGHKSRDVLCRYWCYAWNQSLELVALMQEYYDYTGDEEFLKNELIPMARAALEYFDTRFKRDTKGKLVIDPTQSVETYWNGVINDTPTVAGLIAVLDGLLAMPDASVPAAERAFWKRMRDATPEMPMRMDKGKSFIPPAEKYVDKRNNCENPMLYAVTPFKIYGVGKPHLEIGRETYCRRCAPLEIGWAYDGQAAALLGMTDEAKRQLLSKVKNSHSQHRFPAMWGPNFDWLPDQDHGSNILSMFQYMLLQSAGEKIYVLPAWPREWNVHFKLHAPKQTTVECVYRDGKVVDLKVTPESRRKDVVIMEAK